MAYSLHREARKGMIVDGDILKLSDVKRGRNNFMQIKIYLYTY